MQELDMDRAASWRYQAAVHRYLRAEDPLADPRDVLPSPQDQQRFWTQCQHGSWFFLPWHRMYLRIFEDIVASTVAGLQGPADWALPYWNYGDASNPDARRLPQAFVDTTTPDGEPNPLRIAARDPDANTRQIIATPAEASSAAAMSEQLFTDVPPAAGFGGAVTVFSHSGPREFRGAVESVPHGTMHGAVGGFTGWMSGFATAGLDPVFWLHHANIDRLWNVWRRASGHVNPGMPWLDFQFQFRDRTGAVVTMRPRDVVDTRAIGYQYDDDPPAGPAAPPAPPTDLRVIMADSTPEMVAASTAPVDLSDPEAGTTMTMVAPSGPGVLTAAAASPRRVYLNLEGITGAEAGVNYEVYVGAARTGTDAPPGRLAGILPTFGVPEASRADSEHGGGGIDHSLDITGLMTQLAADAGTAPSALRVSFRPTRVREKRPRVRIARVSIYVR
jgi:tyrosinase